MIYKIGDKVMIEGSVNNYSGSIVKISDWGIFTWYYCLSKALHRSHSITVGEWVRSSKIVGLWGDLNI